MASALTRSSNSTRALAIAPIIHVADPLQNVWTTPPHGARQVMFATLDGVL